MPDERAMPRRRHFWQCGDSITRSAEIGSEPEGAHWHIARAKAGRALPYLARLTWRQDDCPAFSSMAAYFTERRVEIAMMPLRRRRGGFGA